MHDFSLNRESNFSTLNKSDSPLKKTLSITNQVPESINSIHNQTN